MDLHVGEEAKKQPDIVGYEVLRVYKGKNARTGLDEIKALVLPVHAGEESEAENLRKAFSQHGTPNVRKGNELSLSQIDMRITMLEKSGEAHKFKGPLEDLKRVKRRIETFGKTPDLRKAFGGGPKGTVVKKGKTLAI